MRAVDLQVVVSGGVVGRVRIALRDRELVVHEAELVSPDHAEVLGALLVCRAIADEAHRVVLDGDAGALGLLVDAGWAEVVSQRRRLDLRSPSAAPGPGAVEVRLAPMGGEAATGLRDRLAGDGATPGAAPDDPGQHLLTGWHGDRVVGQLWLGAEQPEVVVNLLEVPEEERRRGYGAALLRAAAAWARDQGHEHLRLDVAGQDPAARGLAAAPGWAPVHTTYARPVGA